LKNRFIDTHNFDGIDIDWQYPNGASGGPFDKQNFILLLKVRRKTAVKFFFFKKFFIF
jgi:GH18 family chitinase